MSVNFAGQPTFDGTSYTHEIVVDRRRVALTESLDEAKVVACAVSRALPYYEARIYAAFAELPHSSYRTGWEVT